MFVVANRGRLEMCEVGRVDAYVMGLSRRMEEMCMHHSASVRECVCLFGCVVVRKKMRDKERKKKK